MNSVPITIVDDFLENPESIRNWALSLEFSPPPEGNYPGKRTEDLKYINPSLDSYINRKIVSLFFSEEREDIEITSSTSFQIMDNYYNKGWIHQDENPVTAIIYLNKTTSNNKGTTLYKLKKDRIHPIQTYEEDILYKQRIKHFTTGKISKEENLLKEKWENECFEKVLDIPDKFNRLIVFDPTYFHASNIGDPSFEGDERLTLISFIYKIKSPSLYPMHRVNSLPRF